MAFELPDLPYPHDALEPHISSDTLRHHHGKHHAAYVNKLNQLIDGTDLEGQSLEGIILATADDPQRRGIFNNAAQAWNHTFLWSSMSSAGGGVPGGDLGHKIAEDFGSYEDFRTAFISAAASHFGSGWVWLVLDNGKLRITTTANADLPLQKGEHAIFTCDLWEHAYYVDYRNKRPEYLETFLDKVVNWAFAEQRLADGLEKANAA